MTPADFADYWNRAFGLAHPFGWHVRSEYHFSWQRL